MWRFSSMKTTSTGVTTAVNSKDTTTTMSQLAIQTCLRGSSSPADL